MSRLGTVVPRQTSNSTSGTKGMVLMSGDKLDPKVKVITQDMPPSRDGKSSSGEMVSHSFSASLASPKGDQVSMANPKDA